MPPLPWDAPLAHLGLLAVALAWDALLGEPPAALHPVVWLGRAVSLARRFAPAGRAGAFLHGAAVTALLAGTAAAAGFLAPRVPGLGPVLSAWLLGSSFARRALVEAGGRVADALEAGDLDAARGRLSWLCSRDASRLPPDEVAGAAVESLAENTSDSFVAPLAWYAVAGLPGALAYRALNTLDAMWGYRDAAREWLGKAPARADDLANLAPARLSALLLVVAGAGVEGARPAEGLRVALREHRRTPSPNAGWPIAAMAGLLGLRLVKRDASGGLVVYALGDGGHAPGAADVRTAMRLADRAMRLAALLLAAALALAAAWP